MVSELAALEKMDEELWQNVSAGLSASAAVILLNHQYYGVPSNKGLFKTNISNTLVYKTLESLGKQSVVCTCETLMNYRENHLDWWFEVKGLKSLQHYQDYASRSDSADWKDPVMLEFFSKEMCYLRATRLFQARQSILDRLSALGKKPHRRPENQILPHPGIIKMIRTAMEGVVHDGISLDSSFDDLITLSFDVVNKSVSEKARDDKPLAPSECRTL